MCLIKAHRLPKISRKPIQVYKVFYYSINDNNLISPYQYQKYKVGETIKAKHGWLKGILKNKIKGEGVHAYINKVKHMLATEFPYYTYLCEIPPFTPYWIGNRGDIAASKMTIKEKVEL